MTGSRLRFGARGYFYMLGFVLLVVSATYLPAVFRLAFWTTTHAEVRSVEVETFSSRQNYSGSVVGQNVVIEYWYTVGSNHFFGGGGYPEYPKTSRVASGKETVEILFNPMQPDQSVLKIGIPALGIVSSVAGVLCIMATASYPRWRKR